MADNKPDIGGKTQEVTKVGCDPGLWSTIRQSILQPDKLTHERVFELVSNMDRQPQINVTVPQ